MPDLLHNAWIFPLLPALSFLGILFFGKRLPGKGHEIGIAVVGLCFVLAIGAGAQWIGHVNEAHHAAESGEHGSTEGHGSSKAEADGEHGTSDPAGTHEEGTTDESHESDAGGHAAEMIQEDAPEGHGGGSLTGEEAPAEEGHHVAVDPVVSGTTWFQSGGHKYQVGTFVDGLSVMMLLVVTLISLLVHVYSTDYVHDDRRYTHYFAFLSLFTASMLGLVISRSTVQFVTAWELVGVCSFALIGHWWEEKPNSDAALKAFLTNRVGDVGLLVGMITLFWSSKSFDIGVIGRMASEGEISQTALTVAALSLIAAVMSKSGQFILHTWLPDAMAGPTPVSALIHAATMVVAGVFMVARLYPVFYEGLYIGTSTINPLAVVGAITVVGGASLAFVQSDIKKVLAYSTVSQLGYMVMGLGVGAWTAAVFHLFTHAFFKACLFLGSGSVAHSVHSFDMKADMGGMGKYMPKTRNTFIIGTLALAGAFPFAGFWSKDEILAGAGQLGGPGGYQLMVVMGTIGAFMTAAYMTRCIYLTFYGECRGKAKEHEHHLHESGPRIVTPLYILGALAVVSGFANFPFGVAGEGFKLQFEHFFQPTGDYFVEGLPIVKFDLQTAVVSSAVAFAGFLVAYLWYFREIRPGSLTERFAIAKAGHDLLVNKYYLDRLYTDVIAGGTKGPLARAAYWFNQKVLDGVVNGAGISARVAGEWVYTRFDQKVVDGTVNGAGATAAGAGSMFRRLQTGKVQQYGALLFGSAAVLTLVLVIAVG